MDAPSWLTLRIFIFSTGDVPVERDQVTDDVAAPGGVRPHVSCPFWPIARPRFTMVIVLATRDTIQWQCHRRRETVCWVRRLGYRSGNTLLSHHEPETLETPSEHVNVLSPEFADSSVAGCRFEWGTRERGCRNTRLRATDDTDSVEPAGVRIGPSERHRRQAE
jgi:hypothetical protein